MEHHWMVERNGDGTSRWWCTCGREADDYGSYDAAEDAAEMHVEQED